jgi:RNA polymerase sigma-70 factor, ECF subfamily
LVKVCTRPERGEEALLVPSAPISPRHSGTPVSGLWPERRSPTRSQEGSLLASRTELSQFLASVERKAFKQTVYTVRDEQAALDIVQDAMMRLSEKYGHRPPEELPLLFQRILQNAQRDHFRRTKVRSTWVTLFSGLLGKNDDPDTDPLESLESADDSNQKAENPADLLQREQIIAAISEQVEKLPGRQREAFLLRYWHEMDVAETAAVMGCSEGSVKTHCSRAAHALADALKSRGITL